MGQLVPLRSGVLSIHDMRWLYDQVWKDEATVGGLYKSNTVGPIAWKAPGFNP
jgi:hypothetical protein